MPIALAFVADLVLVGIFAAIGRASHDSAPFGLGLLQTLWPFAVALVIGWIAVLAWRRPLAPVRTGLTVAAITVAGGMLLRALSGQGTALPFVIVATITLLVFLVGWRLVALGIRRLRARRIRSA